MKEVVGGKEECFLRFSMYARVVSSYDPNGVE